MEPHNPYTAPGAQIAEPEKEAIEVPSEILKKIRQAWIAALFTAGITVVVIVISIAGEPILVYTAWEFFDVALVLGLGFGIYKKSRTCAVLMLVYFVASKILIMVETGKPAGLFMGLLFAFFYWQGVSGTFAYHKFIAMQFKRTASRG